MKRKPTSVTVVGVVKGLGLSKAEIQAIIAEGLKDFPSGVVVETDDVVCIHVSRADAAKVA